MEISKDRIKIKIMVTTTITQINRDMEISKDRIKAKIATTTTIGKEVGITHRENGIKIRARDMKIQ